MPPAEDYFSDDRPSPVFTVADSSWVTRLVMSSESSSLCAEAGFGCCGFGFLSQMYSCLEEADDDAPVTMLGHWSVQVPLQNPRPVINVVMSARRIACAHAPVHGPLRSRGPVRSSGTSSGPCAISTTPARQRALWGHSPRPPEDTVPLRPASFSQSQRALWGSSRPPEGTAPLRPASFSQTQHALWVHSLRPPEGTAITSRCSTAIRSALLPLRPTASPKRPTPTKFAAASSRDPLQQQHQLPQPTPPECRIAAAAPASSDGAWLADLARPPPWWAAPSSAASCCPPPAQPPPVLLDYNHLPCDGRFLGHFMASGDALGTLRWMRASAGPAQVRDLAPELTASWFQLNQTDLEHWNREADGTPGGASPDQQQQPAGGQPADPVTPATLRLFAQAGRLLAPPPPCRPAYPPIRLRSEIPRGGLPDTLGPEPGPGLGGLGLDPAVANLPPSARGLRGYYLTHHRRHHRRHTREPSDVPGGMDPGGAAPEGSVSSSDHGSTLTSHSAMSGSLASERTNFSAPAAMLLSRRLPLPPALRAPPLGSVLAAGGRRLVVRVAEPDPAAATGEPTRRRDHPFL
ncbi:hypothetical protein PAPYR_7643 [Paratrimastix pyriformis]|uniref:Uncharacterized protein n=1 Tax=Paratrimastix pyriformis TaxID=342808 RepID=A0ABQ8UCI8_9EUKA|nr:hypothetical protein PAPYR_7643 [Paratrimastix pyriformis]